MDEKENFHQPKLFTNYLPNSAEGKYEKRENIKQKDFSYSMDGMFSQPQTELFVHEEKNPGIFLLAWTELILCQCSAKTLS